MKLMLKKYHGSEVSWIDVDVTKARQRMWKIILRIKSYLVTRGAAGETWLVSSRRGEEARHKFSRKIQVPHKVIMFFELIGGATSINRHTATTCAGQRSTFQVQL